MCTRLHKEQYNAMLMLYSSSYVRLQETETYKIDMYVSIDLTSMNRDMEY